MQSNKSLENQIIELKKLLTRLLKTKNFPNKLKILNSHQVVQDFLQAPNPIHTFFKSLTPEAEFVMKSIIAIGQGPIIFNVHISFQENFNRLLSLLEQLLEIEIFYQHIGGIIGYHLTVISFIVNQKSPIGRPRDTCYIHPEGLCLTENNLQVRQAVRQGIANINKMGVIYPLGGAGDRLNLTDEMTGTPLPAALLPFLGFTLLEGLIRDLQAREYLFFKMFKKQVLTPIAIMTSVEKNNHTHVTKICKSHNWFGRDAESFYFFIQPVVPVITIEGNWSTSAPLTLTLKPCGHGVLWKLAEEQGVFNWFKSKKRLKCLIRQVNNPLAGTDNALLALIGVGCNKKKKFGFVSCERILQSDEGTNVLIERKNEKGYAYCLTNIEYTDFALRGIEEIPAKPGSLFSIYPSNTNILFADIPSIRKIIKKCPIPGLLVNMKATVPYINSEGHLSFVQGGRLESTMQNIADFIVDQFPYQLQKNERKDALRTFILYNDRSKTISTTKKSFKSGESPLSTPEQAYYDILFNRYHLLLQCQFNLPSWISFDQYLSDGPPLIFLFHPALGPLFSLISQKIRKGTFSFGAELQLEIAEVDIEDLYLQGSLLIEAIPPLGTYDENKNLQYGNESRCFLKNVKIKNEGINREINQCYWKNDIFRKEAVKIILHEGAEFHAENITIDGSYRFEVPAHHKLILKPLPKNCWEEELIPIDQSTWYWRYAFNEDDQVILKKIRRRKNKGS